MLDYAGYAANLRRVAASVALPRHKDPVRRHWWPAPCTAMEHDRMFLTSGEQRMIQGMERKWKYVKLPRSY